MLYNNLLFQHLRKPSFATKLANNSLTRGLCIAFPFNAAVGNYIYDHCQYSRIGKFVNNPTWTIDNTGPSVTFQGSGQLDYIMFNDKNLPSGTNPFTFIQWVKTSSNKNGFSFQYGQTSTSFTQFAIGQYDIGAGLHLLVTVGGSNSSADAGIAINDGQWHQIGCIVNGSDVSLFKDGSFINTSNIAQPVNMTLSGSGFISYYDNQDWFGSVSNTLMYNRILSNAEIKSLYNNPWQIYNSKIDQRSLYQYKAQSVPSAGGYEVIIGNFPFSIGSLRF